MIKREIPDIYTIGQNRVDVIEKPHDHDPRGLLLIFEPPHPGATYVMGIDPTVGIVGWNRHIKTRDDLRTDNGAIEVVKLGTKGGPDVQVAEYAAPIDPEDLADVATFLGRLYHGRDEEECLCIIEVYPGPGLLTQRRMINNHNYTNHFIWKYLDSMMPKTTASLGWQSSPKSVRDLWIRGTRHISLDKVRVLSPYLSEELAHCEADELKMTAKASSGMHDDRVRAFLMAIWALHDWNYQIEEPKPEALEGPAPNWQASDISYDKMLEAWETRFDEISEYQE